MSTPPPVSLDLATARAAEPVEAGRVDIDIAPVSADPPPTSDQGVALELARARPAQSEPGRADLDLAPLPPPDPGEAAVLTCTALSPAPRAHIRVVAAGRLTAAVQLPAPQAAISLHYDPNVWRGLVHQALVAHRQALAARIDTDAGWRVTAVLRRLPALAWRRARPAAAMPQARWRRMHPARHTPGLAWAPAAPTPAALAARWPYPQPTPIDPAVRHRPARALPARPAALAWRHPQPRPRTVSHPWHAGAAHTLSMRHPWGPGIARRIAAALPWHEGAPPLPGYWKRPPTPVEPPPPPTPTGTVALELACPYIVAHVIGPTGAVYLRLPPCAAVAPPDGPVVVPRLEIYLVLNTITLTRLADGLAVPCERLGLRLTIDGPHLGWEATVPGWAIDAVRPSADPLADPVVLVAHINGTTAHLRVERIRRRRGFADDRWELTGRGLTAELADAAGASNHTNASMLSAQQAAAAALPGGWTLDWQAIDWVIPAGRWAHHGTPTSAIARLAEAAGAWIRPAFAGRTLTVLPRYPAWPWRWATDLTPDITLPIDAVELEDQEVIDLPGYNVVDVIGDKIYRTRRQGSAGNVAAQQIVEPLLTDALAARARGLTALSPTGRQLLSDYRLMVMPTHGSILVPGQILDLQDGATTTRGLIRGVRVSVDGPDHITQTVSIESYEL